MLLPILGAMSYSLGEIAIGVIIIAAICAVVVIAIKAFGIVVPQWVLHILAVVIIAIIAIIAIRVLLSL